MKIVVSSVIGMVKPNPFQQDLFDFTYIEDQVKDIKKSMENNASEMIEEKSITDMLDEQLAILQDIQRLLTEIDGNTRKKSWFKRSE